MISVLSNARASLWGSIAKAVRPPELLSYSQWAEREFRLAGNTATPGRFRPWKFQRQILDAMGDPQYPFVTVIKSTRTGYTTSLSATVGAFGVNDPCPILVVLPTDDDARRFAVEEVDPAFRASPALEGIMKTGRSDGRSTLTRREMSGGGSLKMVSAASPRNLAAHTTRALLLDEVDRMKITAEGDPVKIAIQRTISYANRKIIMGSTPVDEEGSLIILQYNASDQRIFEIPCIHCDHEFELLWENIDWNPGRPKTAVAICPECGCSIEERHKMDMVEGGDWRATNPEVDDHAGFRMNSLISGQPNVRWRDLAKEYEQAVVDGPAAMQVFYNTSLGLIWSSGVDRISEGELLQRLEDFGIQWQDDLSRWRNDIPSDVAYITAGVDVQGNRLEITFLGHSPSHRYVLGHHVIYGNTTLDTTWEELIYILKTEWKHPLGNSIGISVTLVDSGDGNMSQRVYDFCDDYQSYKIFPCKGQSGNRKTVQVSGKERRGRTAPLYIVGVDVVKTELMLALPLPPEDKGSFRFTNTVGEEWFNQLMSERRVSKVVSGRTQIVFEEIGNRRHEALDCTVYAMAARNLVRVNWENRYEELRANGASTRKSLKDASRKLHS